MQVFRTMQVNACMAAVRDVVTCDIVVVARVEQANAYLMVVRGDITCDCIVA
jgi:hypothetical protein